MITIKLFGGLGNQMFQYALGRALSLKNNDDLFLDAGYFHHDIRKYELAIFDIHAKIAGKKEIPFYQKEIKNSFVFKGRYPFQRICKKIDPNYIIENTHHPTIYPGMYDFHHKILQLTGNKYLEGQRQSEKYFEKIKDIIKKDFILKQPIDDKQNVEMIETIKNTNSVGIHVRRGDYLGSNFAGICEKSYYQKAIAYIKTKIVNPAFFIFSEDMLWCKENLDIGEHFYFVDWNKKKDSYKDMILMSKCKNNIIANSSFSRRGAWLNNSYNKIVVAPKKWHQKLDYADIIPKERVKL